MTPKEKAEELVKKFRATTHSISRIMVDGKQCALICVDEILINLGNLYAENWIEISEIEQNSIFWEQVKQEIEKL